MVMFTGRAGQAVSRIVALLIVAPLVLASVLKDTAVAKTQAEILADVQQALSSEDTALEAIVQDVYETAKTNGIPFLEVVGPVAALLIQRTAEIEPEATAARASEIAGVMMAMAEQYEFSADDSRELASVVSSAVVSTAAKFDIDGKEVARAVYEVVANAVNSFATGPNIMEGTREGLARAVGTDTVKTYVETYTDPGQTPASGETFEAEAPALPRPPGEVPSELTNSFDPTASSS
jgi:hypothetical protein